MQIKFTVFGSATWPILFALVFFLLAPPLLFKTFYSLWVFSSIHAHPSTYCIAKPLIVLLSAVKGGGDHTLYTVNKYIYILF